MRYSIEPKDRIYVKGYGFLSFETTGDSIGNRIADKVTNLPKKPSTKLHSTEVQKDDIEIPKERYVSRKKTINY